MMPSLITHCVKSSTFLAYQTQYLILTLLLTLPIYIKFTKIGDLQYNRINTIFIEFFSVYFYFKQSFLNRYLVRTLPNLKKSQLVKRC